MQTTQSLSWIDPLEAAASVEDDYWVLLYSGTTSSDSGRYSFLATGLNEKIESDNLTALANRLSSNKATFDNCWFGYLGYGLKNSLEHLHPDGQSSMGFSDLCMMQFNHVYQFDHSKRTITHWSGLGNAKPLAAKKLQAVVMPDIHNFSSNMTSASYREKAAYVIEKIRAGELYQANLTRKYKGSFTTKPDAFLLFCKLAQISPAAYSAYVKLGDAHIISSSPELFLKISPDGKVFTCPIKGSAARSNVAAEDERARIQLKSSEKDKAENLMIVDLMRNDLSKSCVPGSVSVDSLFDVTSHATIHHMSSKISAQKMPEASALDVISQCFPPGSMTGAPKIKAMNLCSELEGVARGPYSGAIGWLGGDGGGELSVVIRTLLLRDLDFEFQVGGGIVADSTPESELIELLAKARGLCMALGISEDRIHKL